MTSTRTAARVLGPVVRRVIGPVFVAALVLVSLTACGEDEPPAETDLGASVVEEYCLAYSEYFQERATLGPQAQDSEVIASMKGWAEDLERLEPPEEMSADARAGREKWLELIGQIDGDDTQEDVVALEQDLGEKDMAQVQAFFAFNDETCPKVDANR